MLHRLHLRLQALRHRLLLFLFPSLKAHDKLLNEISALKIESRRLTAELEISQGRLKYSRDEAQTSAITCRSAMDRAAQLTIANEQLQSQLMETTRMMADRLERAYGATANHLAMGGLSTRRSIFPWIESDPGPTPIDRNLQGPIGKTSGRGVVKAQTAQFLQSVARETGDPNLIKAATETLSSLQSKLDSGEYELNALGQPVPVNRLEPEPQEAG